MCECIAVMDKALAERNTKLALTFTFGGGLSTYPTIQTEQVEKGRGKKKAIGVIPSFCCFCGEKYERAKADESALTPKPRGCVAAQVDVMTEEYGGT
jgi:hypothetical protein